MADNRFFSNYVGLIYLAMKPPSITTALGLPPSVLAVELFYSETRACSLGVGLNGAICA